MCIKSATHQILQMLFHACQRLFKRFACLKVILKPATTSPLPPSVRGNVRADINSRGLHKVFIRR